jgi:hypothetical protein
VDFPIGIEWRVSGDLPTTSPSELPRFAELLLCIITRPEQQKERLGCYTELFNEWRQKYGVTTARRLYYLHVLGSVRDIIKISAAAVVIDRLWNWIDRVWNIIIGK